MVRGKMSRSLLCLVIVLSVFLVQSGVALAVQSPINYVAIGDSLAAGMTPTGSFDLGYTDDIAQKLADDGWLGTYQNFGVAGYTTSNVLAALTNDVVPDPYRHRQLVGVREAVSQAKLVTIDAGANDVLNYINDPSLFSRIAGVGVNLTKILKELKALNPNVKIYVMGYYNPYPYYPEAQQAQLETLLGILNSTIEQAAVSEGAVYVPTAQTIAKHTKLYLPVATNIHLSEQGYMAIANDFWSYIKLGLRGE